MSALIDKNTRLPDYIFLVGSTESDVKCVNLHQGEGDDLSGINLEHKNVDLAKLSKSNLDRANLQNSTFKRAKFNYANLSNANLKGATLGGSFLEANFSGADLGGTDLLDAANLSCEQIMSALIDKNTRLPDYIVLENKSESGIKCKNTLSDN